MVMKMGILDIIMVPLYVINYYAQIGRYTLCSFPPTNKSSMHFYSLVFMLKNLDLALEFIVKEWKGKGVFFWQPLLNKVVLVLVVVLQPFIFIFFCVLRNRPEKLVQLLNYPLYILDNKPTQFINLVLTLKSHQPKYFTKVELMEKSEDNDIPVPDWSYLDEVTLDYPFLAKTDNGIERISNSEQLHFLVPNLTVLQEHLKNPPDLAALCGSTRLSSCRVITMRNPKSKKFEVLQGWHRFPFELEGIESKISDRKNFCIGHFDEKGSIKKLQCGPGYHHQTFDSLNHPTTMCDVNDVPLPWDRFQNLALKCHERLTPQAFCVAWDLACLDMDETAKGLVQEFQKEIVLLDKVLAPPLYESELKDPDSYYQYCQLELANLFSNTKVKVA